MAFFNKHTCFCGVFLIKQHNAAFPFLAASVKQVGDGVAYVCPYGQRGGMVRQYKEAVVAQLLHFFHERREYMPVNQLD